MGISWIYLKKCQSNPKVLLIVDKPEQEPLFPDRILKSPSVQALKKDIAVGALRSVIRLMPTLYPTARVITLHANDNVPERMVLSSYTGQPSEETLLGRIVLGAWGHFVDRNTISHYDLAGACRYESKVNLQWQLVPEPETKDALEVRQSMRHTLGFSRDINFGVFRLNQAVLQTYEGKQVIVDGGKGSVGLPMIGPGGTVINHGSEDNRIETGTYLTICPRCKDADCRQSPPVAYGIAVKIYKFAGLPKEHFSLPQTFWRQEPISASGWRSVFFIPLSPQTKVHLIHLNEQVFGDCGKGKEAELHLLTAHQCVRKGGNNLPYVVYHKDLAPSGIYHAAPEIECPSCKHRFSGEPVQLRTAALGPRGTVSLDGIDEWHTGTQISAECPNCKTEFLRVRCPFCSKISLGRDERIFIFGSPESGRLQVVIICRGCSTNYRILDTARWLQYPDKQRVEAFIRRLEHMQYEMTTL